MPTLTPVDFDPFTETTAKSADAGPRLVAVDFDPFAQKPGFGAADVAKSAGIGLAKGAVGIAGMGGDLWSMIDTGLTSAGLDDQQRARARAVLSKIPMLAPLSGPPTADIQKGIEKYTGDFYSPQTTAGEFAQTVGEFAPAAIGGPAGLGRRAVSAVTAGLGSEAAGKMFEGKSPNSEAIARVAGAVTGGLAPGALARAVSPLPVNAGRQAAVDTLRQEGVTDLTAGQTSGRKGLKYFESEMGGSAAANMLERQAEQYTMAVLRRAGETATRATPEVIDRSFTRIGHVFDDIASRNPVMLDGALGTELQLVERNYQQMVPPSSRAPIVADTIRDIGQVAAQTNGVLAGESYMALRSRLDRLARGSSADPQLSDALYGIRTALDDTMARSMGNSTDRAALRDARRQYRNMLVIEKAATSAGEDSALGLISPSALRNATVNQSRRGYARGQGDFGELARAGEAIMKPLPNSGTAPRISAQNVGMGLGAVGGAMVGSSTTDSPLGTGVGAAIGGLLPHIAGRASLSRPVRAYIGNQHMTNPAPQTGLQQALLQALLARQHGLPPDTSNLVP